MEITNFSQMRRALSKGRRFRVVKHTYHPQYTNQLREVIFVQANGVYSTEVTDIPVKKSRRRTYLSFGNESDWSFRNGICTFHEYILSDGKKKKSPVLAITIE